MLVIRLLPLLIGAILTHSLHLPRWADVRASLTATDDTQTSPLPSSDQPIPIVARAPINPIRHRKRIGGQWLSVDTGKTKTPNINMKQSSSDDSTTDDVMLVEMTETLVSTTQLTLTKTIQPAFTSYPEGRAPTDTLTLDDDSGGNGGNQNPPEPQTTLDATAQKWLDSHNAGRKLYGAEDLSWRGDLVTKAKANAVLCNGLHSNAGENIAAQSGALTPEDSVKMWMDEDKLYDWNNPRYLDAAGHFTQVVWKSSRYVGCYIQECEPGTVFKDKKYGVSYQATCEYEPAGNVVNAGFFPKNVGQKV